nr:UL54 [Anatid alphaherpesvirus 1]
MACSAKPAPGYKYDEDDAMSLLDYDSGAETNSFSGDTDEEMFARPKTGNVNNDGLKPDIKQNKYEDGTAETQSNDWIILDSMEPGKSENPNVATDEDRGTTANEKKKPSDHDTGKYVKRARAKRHSPRNHGSPYGHHGNKRRSSDHDQRHQSKMQSDNEATVGDADRSPPNRDRRRMSDKSDFKQSRRSQRSSPAHEGRDQRAINRPTIQQRINSIFERCRATLSGGVQNGGFRTTAEHPWASVLSFDNANSGPEGRRVSWHTLCLIGKELRRMFEIRQLASSAAIGLRAAVLRNEDLIAALASCDEIMAWLKMHEFYGLPLIPNDPIVATVNSLLENLKLKLRPIFLCREMKTRRSFDEMLKRGDKGDIVDLPSFLFITLVKLSRALKRPSDYIPLGDVDPLGLLRSYIPGACITGILEMIDEHLHDYHDQRCKLYSSYVISPVFLHGKYFYCNEMF